MSDLSRLTARSLMSQYRAVVALPWRRLRAALAHRRAMLLWRIRKRCWDAFAVFKFKHNKPADIGVPWTHDTDLRPVPIVERFPRIPVFRARIGSYAPADEASRLRTLIFRIQVWLYRRFSPMQPGLPPISADPEAALAYAYTAGHRRTGLPAPVVPKAYQGADAPDLGVLALQSPYACYLHRGEDGGLQWDFRDLARYERHAGTVSLGCRVRFEQDGRDVRAVSIETGGQSHAPASPGWARAKDIALCAATAHMAMVQHFNGVHLACGEPFSIATRAALRPDHPLRRLLWPHLFGTQQSNGNVTLGLMARGGEFETVYGFTHWGMCRLFDQTFGEFRITRLVPARDWEARGLSKLNLAAPVQDNHAAHFDLFHRHAERYLSDWYADDRAVQADAEVMAWAAKLNRWMPGGVAAVLGEPPTLAGLATLSAAFTYLATVEHEALGTGLWNYQMWVGKHPVRVYEDGRRIPLDLYQRLVNMNFILNVRRAKLMRNFGYLALDGRGKTRFTEFLHDLDELDKTIRGQGTEPWRLRPGILEANINA